MSRINIACFDQNKTPRVYGIWQWDYGQVLRIQGLSLPAAVEIHFSLMDTGGEAERRIGTTKDKVTDVAIPDSMLRKETSSDYFIYAFIYLTDDTYAQTTHKVILHIKARSKPKDYIAPDDPLTDDPLRDAVLDVSESADRSEGAEKSAEAWTHGHPEYPERDEDNAKYYAGMAKEAADHAEQAAEKSGYMQFDIENGRLIETVTDNVGVGFVMEEGRLYLL